MNKSNFLSHKIHFGAEIIAIMYVSKEVTFISTGKLINNVYSITFTDDIFNIQELYDAVILNEYLMDLYSKANITGCTDKQAKVIFAIYKIFTCETVNQKYSSEIFLILYNYKIQDYIIKPVEINARTNSDDLREYMIWNMYAEYRKLYCKNYDSLLLAKFCADNNALLLFRRNGLDLTYYLSKNPNYDLHSVIFLVACNLIILHQACFIHANLTTDNIVYSKYGSSSKLLQFDKFKAKNISMVYDSLEIINFSKAISFNESEALLQFIKLVVPELYAKYEKLLATLAKISCIDLAVASSQLDLLYFLQQTNSNKSMRDYLHDSYEKYLIGDTKVLEEVSQKYHGGAEIEGLELLNHQSVFTRDVFDLSDYFANESVSEFVGGENDKGTNNIFANNLPLWKFLQEFYS